MTGITTLAIQLCALILAAASTAPSDLDKVAFIAGSWVSEKDGTTTEEHWTVPQAGTMLAVARTMKDGKTVFFEYLRIEASADGVAYIAQPRGRAPTSFKLNESTDTRAVFENPEHDFPRRIIYSREGENLRARIEGTRNGKPTGQEWLFTPLQPK
ncbi:MAG: DUF6265 family protein [Tepidisphaeraceae bacterium]